MVKSEHILVHSLVLRNSNFPKLVILLRIFPVLKMDHTSANLWAQWIILRLLQNENLLYFRG